MSTGTIRYWAAARAAAGVAEEGYTADTLAAVLSDVQSRHDERFARILAGCSFLVDGAPVGTRRPDAVRLAAGATIEVLPPFAGG